LQRSLDHAFLSSSLPSQLRALADFLLHRALIPTPWLLGGGAEGVGTAACIR
jgi:hypothetical protein